MQYRLIECLCLSEKFKFLLFFLPRVIVRFRIFAKTFHANVIHRGAIRKKCRDARQGKPKTVNNYNHFTRHEKKMWKVYPRGETIC